MMFHSPTLKIFVIMYMQDKTPHGDSILLDAFC